MADNTPSLGELASAGQSMTPVATTAVTDQRELVRNLNENARFKAENDWRKYQDFQQRLGGLYQNLGEIEKMEVMDEDKAELQKDAAELYQKIAQNPKAFTTDMKGWGELNAAYGALASKATESKQNNLFDKANRQFLLQNNELNSDENRSVIDSYRKMPLGSRQAYNLSLQPIFDANTYANNLKTQIEKDYSPQTETTFGGKDEATGKFVEGGDGYMRERTKTTIPYQDFINRWDASLSMMADKNNQPIKGWAEKQYNSLPDDIKKQVSLEQFWNKIGQNLYGSSKDEKGNVKDIVNITKDEIRADPNYLKKQTIEQQDRVLDETTRHHKAMEGLGWEKIKFDNADDEQEASGTIIQINSVIEDATRPENLKFVIDPKGNRQQMGTLADPELLKRYATIDKDGRVTNTADDALIDRTSGQVSLVYYKKDDDGNIKKSPQGAAIIERSVPVNTSSWVSSVVGRNESTKNKGKIINIVQGFYDKNGGIYKTARKLNQEKPKEDAAKAPAKGIADYAPDVQAGIRAVMDKNNLSEEEAIKLLKTSKNPKTGKAYLE